MTEPKSSPLADAAIALVVDLNPVTSALMAALNAAHAHQQDIAVSTLERMVHNLQPDQISERLGTDPSIQALFVNGMDYALRTGLDAKRKLLADSMRAAISDAAKVDEASLVIDALGQLDAPHIQALQRGRVILEEGPPGWEGDSNLRKQVNDAMFELWETVPKPVDAALVRTGCAKPPASSYIVGAAIWKGPTQFGLDLLAQLDAVR